METQGAKEAAVPRRETGRSPKATSLMGQSPQTSTALCCASRVHRADTGPPRLHGASPNVPRPHENSGPGLGGDTRVQRPRQSPAAVPLLPSDGGPRHAGSGGLLFHLKDSPPFMGSSHEVTLAGATCKRASRFHRQFLVLSKSFRHIHSKIPLMFPCC